VVADTALVLHAQLGDDRYGASIVGSDLFRASTTEPFASLRVALACSAWSAWGVQPESRHEAVSEDLLNLFAVLVDCDNPQFVQQ
jgi:hypothetical protein